MTVAHQRNEGSSVAKNHGLELAEGSYIIFVDSDDIVYPQYCEMLFHAVKTMMQIWQFVSIGKLQIKKISGITIMSGIKILAGYK